MSAHFEALITTLKGAGYSDRETEVVEWKNRRWFAPEGTAETIFQIIIGNAYIRIVCDSENPKRFVVAHRESEKHQERPKTEFYLAGSPDREDHPALEWQGMDMDEIVRLVRRLEGTLEEKAAA